MVEHMWKGKLWEDTLEAFDGSGKVGAEVFAIETLGGKEPFDEGIMYCDITKCLFALNLGCTDMTKIWTEIVKIADKHGVVPGGDTACGFANTAMVLSEKKYIPSVFAAVIRVMASVRSIVAQECGARGPDKDCGYEGPYIKAIAGIPISMEGRVAACAHFSSCGNIASCVVDCWSNESVHNIQMLSGPAPSMSIEQLIYDCRLMNEAIKRGPETALLLRDMNADTDSKYDAHAYIMRPDVVLDISKEMVKVEGHFPRMKKAALLAADAIKKGHAAGKLELTPNEVPWIDTITKTIEGITDDEEAFNKSMLDQFEKFNPKHYDM